MVNKIDNLGIYASFSAIQYCSTKVDTDANLEEGVLWFCRISKRMGIVVFLFCFVFGNTNYDSKSINMIAITT